MVGVGRQEETTHRGLVTTTHMYLETGGDHPQGAGDNYIDATCQGCHPQCFKCAYIALLTGFKPAYTHRFFVVQRNCKAYCRSPLVFGFLMLKNRSFVII